MTCCAPMTDVALASILQAAVLQQTESWLQTNIIARTHLSDEGIQWQRCSISVCEQLHHRAAFLALQQELRDRRRQLVAANLRPQVLLRVSKLASRGAG